MYLQNYWLLIRQMVHRCNRYVNYKKNIVVETIKMTLFLEFAVVTKLQIIFKRSKHNLLHLLSLTRNNTS